jgi:acyl-coenzyme A thioesterase PaaI-like protein
VSHLASFRPEELSTAEVDAREAVYRPLGDSVRDLADAALHCRLDRDALDAATAEVEAVVARLRASQLPGPYGVRYNAEGRAWSWGNAVVGIRNALAPPMRTHRDASDAMHAEVSLGPVHEGDPGTVHPGVASMLLDHLMGETASGGVRVTMTGTLTMRHLRAVTLGPVRLDARIDRIEGAKVYVVATLGDPDGVAVESDGVFVIPRWARPPE